MATSRNPSVELRAIFREKIIVKNSPAVVAWFLAHTVLGILISLHTESTPLLIFFILSEIYIVVITSHVRKFPVLTENTIPIIRLAFVFWAIAIAPNPIFAGLFLFEIIIANALTNATEVVLIWSVLAIMGATLAAWGNPAFDSLSPEFLVSFLMTLVSIAGIAHLISAFITKTAVDFESERMHLREAGARYDVLLNSVGDGMIIVDRDGVIEFVNRRALDLLSQTREMMLGQPMSASVIMQTSTGETIIHSQYPLTSVLKSGQRLEVNQASKESYLIARGDNSKFPISMSISPVKLTGSIQGAVVLFNDVSELEELEKAKSEFVSLASHQLRTPLNVVSWYVEKIMSEKRGKLNEKQKSYMAEIETSNKRMINLVGDLLNVSRVDLGRRKRKHEEVNLNQLIESLVKEVKLMAERKQISFKMNVPSKDRVLANSDFNMLTVVIQNLISNALKYTPEKGEVLVGLIGVSANEVVGERSKRSFDKKGVVISVKDTGVGIPDSQKDKIFGRLFRAENAQKMDVAGTGLGLYVTKSFAELLDGDIWFDSVQGKGTTFYVFIPD